ncbi:hypothetical protein BU16DRAFT_540806 [Lophium mytilinum]|uniref:Sensitive to high expression protein 9, mitochondrial n=1 Tax=Lophium mytilinum TaxID=390894 RepID=A0A6A6QP84_9PEZI|nr:hypothetical protein BU16DRAFT_540806 [Lophium mytilinum]
MRPMLQHASRSLFDLAGALARPAPSRIALLVNAASSPASVCLRCQFRVSARQQKSKSQLAFNGSPSLTTRRLLSTSPRHLQEPPKPLNTPSQELSPRPESTTPPLSPPPPPPPIPPKSEDTIARVSDKDLPSHRDRQRWNLSKRFSELMDDLLPKLAVVTQKVNNYTGTDYSGIEALRREIREQEELVRSRRLLVEDAKQAMDAALAQQSASQKEIVRLLERKNSWLDSELERYMSLIRSEHANDQAVSAAKDSVLAAEVSLEEARSHLEKRERAQYHEEQIWSDTIRRNSTWVTFGLMGVNIFLLLASLVVIDPWRRRRLVREIRRTLDEQKPVLAPIVAPAALAAPTSLTPAVPVQSFEDAIDSVVEPAGVTLESLGDADTSTQDTPASTTPTVEAITPPQAFVAAADDPTSRETPEIQAVEVVQTPAQDPVSTPQPDSGETPAMALTQPHAWQQRFTDLIQHYREYFLDLLSERPILLRKVDMTAATLEGAAVGALLMSLLLALVRPR